MRSYDSYRALVVLATILAHMTGTLTVRVTGNKTKRHSGESSSSALILSIFLFPRLISFSVSVTSYVCSSLSHTRKRSLPPSSRPRVTPPSSYHLFLPPSPSSWCGRTRVHHPRSLYVDPFFTLYFPWDIHITSNTTCIFYSIFILSIFLYFLSSTHFFLIRYCFLN